MLDRARRNAHRFPIGDGLGGEFRIGVGFLLLPAARRARVEADGIFAERVQELGVGGLAMVALAIVLHRALQLPCSTRSICAATLVLRRSCGARRGSIAA